MSPGRGIADPEFHDAESLLREARRRAQEVVLDELVTGLVRSYRQQLEPYLTSPTTTPDVPTNGAGPVTTATSGGSAARDASGVESRKPDPVAARRPIGTNDEGRVEPEAAWYVYAIVRRAEFDDLDADEVAGIENRPVGLVRGGDLAAVTAQVPLAGFRQVGQEPLATEESWLAASVRSHEMVVAHVFGRATVLPLRFGALYPSAEDVADVLRTQGEPLQAELLRLQGTAEWGVTAELTRPDQVGRPAAANSVPSAPADDHLPSAERPSPLDESGAGTAWMRNQQSAARARSRARQDCEQMAGEIHQAAVRHARDSVAQGRSPGSGAGRRLLDRSYLVERHREDRFRLELGSLSDRFGESGLQLRVTGPWPPYHFVRLPERIGHG